MFQEKLDYAMARYRDNLREAERRRSGVYEDWHRFNLWEAVQQAVKRVVRSFNQTEKPCLVLQPACEMPFG